jgi:hypothetical protein
MEAGGRVEQRAWDGRGGDEGGETEGSGEQASEGRARRSRSRSRSGNGSGSGSGRRRLFKQALGRRTCNKRKQDSESIKTEKRRRVGDGATGPWAGERAGGRERLSWGATEMAAMYQASRSDAQTCIGRRVGQRAAQRRTKRSRSKHREQYGERVRAWVTVTGGG